MWTELELEETKALVRLGVAEDGASGDPTTELLVAPETQLRGRIVARMGGVLAGLPCATEVFKAIDGRLTLRACRSDGERVAADDTIADIEGGARSVLLGERLALNFLQRLSGVATLTAKFVEAIAGTKASIFDTRKTTPGWRRLEKYAVRCGGGTNHRTDLASHVLIKDNHLRVIELREGLSRPEAVARAVEACRRRQETIVEVEVEEFDQMVAACRAVAKIVMLDNMPLEEMRRCVKYVRSLASAERPLLEASGGIALDNVRAVAEAGVDRISVGALTHSAPALSMSLEVSS